MRLAFAHHCRNPLAVDSPTRCCYTSRLNETHQDLHVPARPPGNSILGPIPWLGSSLIARFSRPFSRLFSPYAWSQSVSWTKVLMLTIQGFVVT